MTERQEPSSTKPAVTYQDKLWTQIDILDDVKELSKQMNDNSGTFSFKGNPEFNKSLDALSQAQRKLLDTMTKNADTLLAKPDDDAIWEIQDLEAIKRKLFNYGINSQYQLDIKGCVDDIRNNLTEVNKSIEKIDQTSRDIWNEME
ncbi:hypothetical protein BABINDRAFT_159274 [Babjeviella inositovora NRRL Y-12698]|uniref:Uncharacterized protein n=1 Tax=Babjeviella inositovora NRRL Y-12698 TaxID=984486 RepID=A0A1E3QYR1_9ASCO|nr:uncharacterized protein BABINDRAFT_159274 [Babjeviella inositovora NRRL Y-12698]ODQ82761.1 hypothetical protein BABINDRAFT_159274 [Babjeviella inositovora NRRL Y-12698]